jgi:hypothetical protein
MPLEATICLRENLRRLGKEVQMTHIDPYYYMNVVNKAQFVQLKLRPFREGHLKRIVWKYVFIQDPRGRVWCEVPF